MYTIPFKISNPSHYNDGDYSIITLLPQLTWKYLCTVFITILLACSDIMFSHHQQLGRHTQCICVMHAGIPPEPNQYMVHMVHYIALITQQSISPW